MISPLDVRPSSSGLSQTSHDHYIVILGDPDNSHIASHNLAFDVQKLYELKNLGVEASRFPRHYHPDSFKW